MTFVRELLYLFAVEAAESRRPPAERPNQGKLRNQEVTSAGGPHFIGERQAKFSFALHAAQWGARNEKARVQRAVREIHKREIGALVRGLESAAQQLNGVPHVFHPGCDRGG